MSKLKTLADVARLAGALAVAVRAGILLNRTIREELTTALKAADIGSSEPTTEYPEGSLGHSIQQAVRNATESMKRNASATASRSAD